MGHTARLCNVTSEMLHLVVSDNRNRYTPRWQTLLKEAILVLGTRG
jgi:hypothetical protein